MKIHIDGKIYEMPPDVENQLIGQFYQFLAQIYMSEIIPQALRIAAKPIARHELEKKEKALNKAGLDGKMVRPAPGADPALRVMELELAKMREEGKLQHVSLHIATQTDSATICNLSLSIEDTSQGRGSLPTARSEREWEDNGGKDVRSFFGKAFSHK